RGWSWCSWVRGAATGGAGLRGLRALILPFGFSLSSRASLILEIIYWYRLLPGRGPAYLVNAVKGSKEVADPVGRLSVSEDRRSSTLWLAWPRLWDSAVYYCALVARGEEPGLRPDTNLFGRGRGTVPSVPAGGAACREVVCCASAPCILLHGIMIWNTDKTSTSLHCLPTLLYFYIMTSSFPSKGIF
uniref:Immunoglobulin V-set domain-containing protein n=1 Tax=Coturnix japonica TaxID=93934 RepID=A0A8C2U9S1_COTJA